MNSSLEKNNIEDVGDVGDVEGVTDLKKILSGKSHETEPDKKSTYKLSDRMQLMMDYVDEERNTSQNRPWSKLDKSIKHKLLGEFILKFVIDNELSEKNKLQLTKLLNKSLSNNLLNKQADINYNIQEHTIEKINILYFNENKGQYEIKMKENTSRVTTKSKTNIDRLASQSKKKNR